MIITFRIQIIDSNFKSYSFQPIYTNNGTFNEDLPNSWECPKCCKEGKESKVIKIIDFNYSISSFKFVNMYLFYCFSLAISVLGKNHQISVEHL